MPFRFRTAVEMALSDVPFGKITVPASAVLGDKNSCSFVASLFFRQVMDAPESNRISTTLSCSVGMVVVLLVL